MPANQSTPEVTRAEEARRLIGKLAAADIDVSGTAAIGITSADIIAANDWLSATPARGGDELRATAQFLSDRLDDLEWMDGDLESTLRDFMGHVDPAHARLKSALASTDMAGAGEGQHPDDVAVDRFAATMKDKLAAARAKGRGGWDDPEQCSTAYLNRLLHEHVAKGDPVDVANFCMMLAHYGASIAAPQVEGLTSGEGIARAAAAMREEWLRRASDHPGDFFEAMAQVALASPKATATASVREADHIAGDGKLVEQLRSYAGTCTGLEPRRILTAAADRLATLTDSGTAATIGGERA